MAERTRARRGSTSTRRSARSEPAGGGKLNRDYSGEEYREPSEGYQGEQPTKGLYTAELFDLRDHTSQDGNESLRWGFRLAEGSENKHGDDVSGFPDFIYTNENSAWKEQQMLVALGVIKPGGKVNLSYEGIVKKAKQCTVKIGMERYIPEDGDPEWRGRMEAFLPLRDATAPTRKRAKAEDADEEEFDDETGDLEDDEDDAPATRSRRSTSRSRRKAAEPEPEEDEEDEPEEDEEEEGDGDYDPDELAAELTDLSVAALKKRAREEFGVKITRGMDADDIIEAVLDTLDEDGDDEDEDEPEEEPEPPKRRGTSRTKTGSGTARRSKRGSNEPPF